MIPAPNKYEPARHINWMKREIYTAGCRPKGKFGDKPKITSTEEIGKIKKAIPPPGKYKEDLNNWKS